MESVFKPERKRYSIVLLGDFNPAMFQPEWFCRNDILSVEDVNFAKDQEKDPVIVTPQATFFKTPQLDVTIKSDRFEVIASKEPYLMAKDFMTKVLDKLGSYTITAYGFNVGAHYPIDSAKTYQLIGDRLAPKKYWVDLLKDEVSGDKRNSGLLSLQMHKKKDDGSGSITMLFQPSSQFNPGVFISSNDHSEMKEEDQSAEIVMEMIESRFESTIKNLFALQETVLEKVVASEDD